MRRDGEHGAALVITMLTLTALLGVAGFTALSVRSELQASGQGRFQQQALYAAESGVSATLELLRTSCDPAGGLFTAFVSPSNSAPLSPAGIPGNGVRPGQPGNPFTADLDTWYEVTLLNNPDDPGFATGQDADGIIAMRVTGHGPNQSQVVLQVQVRADACIAELCARDYAQRGMSARNDALAACSRQIDAASGTRTLTPGN